MIATTEDTLADALARAADKIADADFILLAAGAGFSADSGLPVYNDIAAVEVYQKMGLEYQDLCDPNWLEEDEQTFYGFWGNCLDAYRDTNPHTGYAILRKWKQRLADRRQTFRDTFHQLKLAQSLPPDVKHSTVTNEPFFVYTSNVDGHFQRCFQTDEVYELHGSLEFWQCAGSIEGKIQPCEGSWRLPGSVRFRVNLETMRADGESIVSCPSCQGKARPNVLMFHDKSWIPNSDDEARYVAWEAVMEKMLENDPSLKLVVLEIGCGMRVPSVRKETEMVVGDVYTRCTAKDPHRQAQATLIRINPDFPSCDNRVLVENDLVLPVRTTALSALTRIDAILSGRG